MNCGVGEDSWESLGLQGDPTSPFWRRSAFFTVQLSHPHMTTGKTIALTRRTLVCKATSLLLNMLSRLVITFLSRSKRLLISWLQSPSAVILEPKKIKSEKSGNKRWKAFLVTWFEPLDSILLEMRCISGLCMLAHSILFLREWVVFPSLWHCSSPD